MTRRKWRERPQLDYDAFISYSSALHGVLASSLQHWLERFATPWYRPRSLRIFRDYTSLSASYDLWGALEEALSRSSWLILLASPAAAQSKWVTRELAWWRAHRPAERVCIVLTSGELHWSDADGDWDWERTDALPPSARGMFVSEPLWVDLSSVRATRFLDRSNPVLLNSVAQIAAPLRGTDKDHLVGRHIDLHRRARRQRRLGLVGLVLLSLLAGTAAVIAVQQRNTALDQRNRALSNYLLTQADRLRAEDVSLASQLDLLAYRTEPTAAVRTRLINDEQAALSRPLAGHTGSVDSLSFNAAGSVLATGSADKTVRLWGIGTAGKPRVLGHPLPKAEYAAFRPDGGILATVGGSGPVRLWDVSDPARPVATGGSLPGITFASFRPDGRVVAVQEPDGHDVRLWDVADPKRPVPLGRIAGRGHDLTSAAFSPGGRLLVAGSLDKSVQLWDVGNPRLPRPLGAALANSSGWVLSLAFSPDGRTLAIGGTDNVRLWNVKDPAKPTPVGDPWSGFHSVAFSPDGRELAMGSDGYAEVWTVTDPASPALLHASLNGHDGAVRTLAFSPDGRRLATGSLDRTARLWDIPRTSLTGHSGSVEAMAFRGDGRVLATGGDHTIRLWDLADPARPKRLGAPLDAHGDFTLALAFSRSGKLLAAGGGDNAIRLWNVADPARPRLVSDLPRAHKKLVSAVAFSADGRFLVSGSQDATLRIWDVSDPRHPANTLTADSTQMGALAFSPDGRIQAGGGLDQQARLWDMSDPAHPNLLREWKAGHSATSFINNDFKLAFSPDGDTLATGGADHTLHLWDIGDPARPKALGSALTGHTGEIHGVAFSADGRMLVSADDDVRLWNVTDCARPSRMGDPLMGNHRGTFALALSPDGTTLATGGHDDTVRIWNLDAETAISRICQATTGKLDDEQWRRYAPGVPHRELCPS
ncbi:hypothetical protein ACWDBW_42430 [Streptomyces sp. NPDC001107]